MKKAQSSTDFMITYGWAILVVIAAVAALWYFGVIDPNRIFLDSSKNVTNLSRMNFT